MIQQRQNNNPDDFDRWFKVGVWIVGVIIATGLLAAIGVGFVIAHFVLKVW